MFSGIWQAPPMKSSNKKQNNLKIKNWLKKQQIQYERTMDGAVFVTISPCTNVDKALVLEAMIENLELNYEKH